MDKEIMIAGKKQTERKTLQMADRYKRREM